MTEAGRLSSRPGVRRALVAIAVVVGLCVVAAGLAYGYLRYRVGQISRLACTECAPTQSSGGRAMTVLVVGSDTRANISRAEAKSFCKTQSCSDQSGGEHSDTMMLIHFQPGQSRLEVLSIPRDLNVRLPGSTRRDRINASFAQGAGKLVQAIHDNLAIDVNHFVVVDFVGFRSIVAALGGMDAYFAAPARDKESGLQVDRSGCVHLDPNSALALVRSRHYEELKDGRWRTDPTSDFGRIRRQQDFLRRVMKKAASVRNPLTINSLLASAVHAVKVDDGLGQGDIFRLANRLRSLSPDAADMLSLPTEPIDVGGASELKLKQPDAGEIIDRFLHGTVAAGQSPLPVDPSTVRVRVLNGTGVAGQAATVATQLQGLGFKVVGTSSADSFRYIKPVVRYGPGQQEKAAGLAATVVGGAQLQQDASIRDVDAVLVTGSAFSGIRSPAGSKVAAPPAGITPGSANATAAPHPC